MSATPPTRLGLKPGDLVQIRPPADILATLDATGAHNGLPFMPEMLQYLGQRFTVAKRVEKICDTVCKAGSRRMHDTVFLEDLRCDGTAHGGCQAECRLYWKEAWLVRVDGATARQDGLDPSSMAVLGRLTRANTRPSPDRGPDVYRCQATEAFRASTPIGSVVSPAQYVREITAGNVGLTHMLRVGLRAVSWKIGARLGFNIGSRQEASRGADGGAAASNSASLELRPGDWVEVRSAEEIGRTLNAQGSHRGLRFSAPEMLPACGRKFRVRRRIERLIDERNGRLLTMKNDCIALEGFVCTGERSPGRWFCARELYPYWREAWLKRVSVHRDVEPTSSAELSSAGM